MKVGISGVLGFIGGTLAARYRGQGHDVVGIDAVADGSDPTVVAADIVERGPWEDVFAGCDLVIHTAAVVANHAPDDRMWGVNVLGTSRVLQAAIAAGVPRFVHLSSVRAYSDLGFPDGVDEAWPIRTDGHGYVDTKVASEQVVLQAHAESDVDVTVIRPGDVYGPRSVPWTEWPVMGIPMGFFLVPSEGGIFSPVYVDNLVDGIVLGAGDEGRGQVFNVSDGVGVDNEEFFGHYARMLHTELPVAPAAEIAEIHEAAGLGADTVDYFLRQGTYSIDKARRVLGYEPAVDVAEGMARTETWLRSEGRLPETG